MSEKEVKKNLLKHYASGKVHRFLQLDGFYVPGTYDSVVIPDKDGDWCSAQASCELRHSDSDLAVRVFVHEGTKNEDAVRLLKKLTAWMIEDPDLYKLVEADNRETTFADHPVHGFRSHEPWDDGQEG
jgi:hypothetical protein